MSEATTESGRVNVHSLICHRDVDLGLYCLKSLETNSCDPARIVLHDDGSLTEIDYEKLRSQLQNPGIVSRKQADDAMAEHLRGYPHAATFRRDSVWGLKLLDIVLLEENACFYCDGDIRFFRPFHGLFTPRVAAGRSIFISDTVWEAYSVRPWHLLDRRGLKVMAGINTGLTIIDRKLFDLEFVDWFLSQPDWRCIPAWTEPTCWAALGIRSNGHVVDPAQLVNLYPRAKVAEGSIGGHFLASHRHLWQEELIRERQPSPDVAEIRLQRGRECSALRLTASQLRRKIQNTVTYRNARRAATRSAAELDRLTERSS